MWQPWASLIAIGAKQYETRSWATRYRGPLAIHAAQAAGGLHLCGREPFQSVLLGAGVPSYKRYGRILVNKHSLPFGAIVAVAELVTCVPTEQCGREDPNHFLSPKERAFGDFSPRRFAWEMADVRRLAEPIPCRGAQGLWDVPEEILDRIDEQLGRGWR